MFDMLGDGVPKRRVAEEDHPVETLLLDRPDKPLGERIKLGLLGGSRTGSIPIDRRIVSNPTVNFMSRSRSR
jgi:hypothetical protein